ncbi:MAG: Type I restriction-modification system, DNA-methyltransferase subunit M [Candidatus Jettenia ecosi]|uniref:site-specific DNA-methyltransferase (adenine-specific) n=1 Tax=Candidatus Jettenia ecosi TaxID=2494326 RepID=A0A533QF90_9BACT|nr:MAG: Type I restriction-modification system, DNA-methyltransferase subunit M [Candidatus Jettenia ecosi]
MYLKDKRAFMNNFREKANLIWSIADLLRGHYKQADYGKVILPFTVLRRLDMVLAPTKKLVLEAYQKHKDKKPEVLEPILNGVAKAKFHNRSKFDFHELAKDHNNVAANLRNYMNGFSISAREIIDYFSFDDQIRKLDEYDLLYLIIKEFAKKEDTFKDVDAMEMGYIFEELIRKFAELSNETAGEHFTPREVIRLMVNLLFAHDKDILRKEGIVKTLYDPACGTGGMLSIAGEYLHDLNSGARLELFGQEINPESYAICKSDMLIKGQNPANIKFGNSFTQDGLEDETFDYMLSNPPFGVDWKKAQKYIRDEYENRGFAGRFGAGLPSISDGSLLFLQHMISKMKRSTGGSRIAIVFNGSPLFSGAAGRGPGNIRKWIIENDMLEAIIAMPDQLFYNTGISTYIWIVTDRKTPERKGKVQLINASGSDWEEGDKSNPFSMKMMRSLGNKRKEIGDGRDGKPDQIKTITKLYEAFKDGPYCKIFNNEDFGYHRITVERPKRNKRGEIETDRKGDPVPDADLRDYENVPLKEDIEEYFKREVLPHLPDAWIDHSKTKTGYEINFTKYFYQYKPLRSLEEIRRDILALEKETEGMIKIVLD